MKMFILLIGIPAILLPGIAQAQDTSYGMIWYPAIELSDSTHNGYEPKIALSGDDTLHVTWNEDYGGVKLPYARSVTGGSTFEPTMEMLPDSIRFPERAHRPFGVANGAEVYLLFTNVTFSPVRLVKSTNAGRTWGPVRDITSELSTEITSATIEGGAIVCLVPINGYRRVLRSLDHGTSWVMFNENLGYYNRVALSPGTLHMVEQKAVGPIGETGYRRSANFGYSWNLTTLLSSNDGIFSDLPAIAAASNECGTDIVTAWRDTKYGTFGWFGASIISRVSLADGATWLPENLMTTEPKETEPRIALHGNTRAVVTWYEVVAYDTLHIAVHASNNSLLSYSPRTDISPMFRTGSPPHAAVSSHAVHVVWEEKQGSTFRVMYRRGEFIPKDVSFSLSTGLLEFDSTDVSETAVETLSVSNSGSDSLVVGTIISTDENFSPIPTALVVPPFSSQEVLVRFTPGSIGLKSGKIIFYHGGKTSPDCITVTGMGRWRKQTVSYHPGWNLVSIPLRPGYAQTLPSLFSYDHTYVRRDTLEPGRGYWARPPVAATFSGVGVWADTLNLVKGWNVIGTVSGPVPVTTISTVPESLLTTGFYEYLENTYSTRDTLMPAKAYWVKAQKEGKVIFTSIRE